MYFNCCEFRDTHLVWARTCTGSVHDFRYSLFYARSSKTAVPGAAQSAELPQLPDCYITPDCCIDFCYYLHYFESISCTTSVTIILIIISIGKKI